MDYHPDFLPYIWTKLSKKLTLNLGHEHEKDKTPRHPIGTTLKDTRHRYPEIWHMQTMWISSVSLEKAQETVQIGTKVLKKYNRQLNQSKT